MSPSNSLNGAQSSKTGMSTFSLPTRAMHADDHLNSASDVAPAIHVSTTFHYDQDPAELKPIPDEDLAGEAASDSPKHYYSRLASPNTTRLEAVLSSVLHGQALTYSSGLAAFHALLVFVNPKVVAIGDGYHGCHGVLKLQQKLSGVKKVDLFDEASWDAAGLSKGDIVHVETPLNPTGEAFNLSAFAAAAHQRGAYLTVDATFGPPGLQEPFAHGADFVMHSGTKYIGGHSDLLLGVLATQRAAHWAELWVERLHLGSAVGSLEGWLGVRSLRTLELRVMRQSESATALVAWLDGALRRGITSTTTASTTTATTTTATTTTADADADADADAAAVRTVVARVQHASLQKADMHWLAKQMPRGYGPVFAIWMQTAAQAKALPSKLALFHHATSLGGVESLIEWRRMSDDAVDERLMRVSVGVESVLDLKRDLLAGFRALAEDHGGVDG